MLLFYTVIYGSDTVNSKSFISKVLLRIKWKFELTVDFKHEMIEKIFTDICMLLFYTVIYE